MIRTIDVIIPVYRPDAYLPEAIKRLLRQTKKIRKIVIINTEKRFYDAFEKKFPLEEMYDNLEVHHIAKADFDHGATRNLGVSYSDADAFLMMTDDCLPADSHLAENLLSGLLQEKTAVAYARQLPGKDAGEVERFTRAFNYPDEPALRSAEDVPALGIRTYFCSNVCALYRRDVFDALGGFPAPMIFNEDLVYAAGAVHAGWQIAYVPSARVYHSHHYNGIQQFKRNFDQGVSQAKHPEIFDGISSESEGVKLVKDTALHLFREGLYGQIPGLIYTSGMKYLGFLAGKHYQALPPSLVPCLSMNRDYWRQAKEENTCAES